MTKVAVKAQIPDYRSPFHLCWETRQMFLPRAWCQPGRRASQGSLPLPPLPWPGSRGRMTKNRAWISTSLYRDTRYHQKCFHFSVQGKVNWLLLDQLQQSKEPLFEHPKYQGQDNSKVQHQGAHLRGWLWSSWLASMMNGNYSSFQETNRRLAGS